MSCPRCQGLLVPDSPLRFLTLEAALDEYTPPGDCPQRCLSCGNVVDAQILANRAAQSKAGLRQMLHEHDRQVA